MATYPPRPTAHHALSRPQSRGPGGDFTAGVVAARASKSGAMPPRYRLQSCTTNLGAAYGKTGHPSLKHCFARLLDERGAVVATWALGLHGVVAESNGSHPSVVCYTEAEALSRDAADGFDEAFRQCDARPYAWGSNDCCSCLRQALQDGMGIQASQALQSAARDIARSTDLSRSI
jgi:hypothetical protein